MTTTAAGASDDDYGSSSSFLRSHFHHYDVQSVVTEIGRAATIKTLLGVRRNTTTGASAASKVIADSDHGDFVQNELVLSCPYFRNEIPTYADGLPSANKVRISVLEDDSEQPDDQCEYIDNFNKGAGYYRKHFYEQEHENWIGVDENVGPVAISIRKDRMSNNTSVPFYRVIYRSSEVATLRGSVSEEVILNGRKNANPDKVYAKEIIETLFPHIQSSCLRLGDEKTACDILLKLDEQGVTTKHKVGVLYCKAYQSTEEEMYNNEHGSPAFDEFLQFLGNRVRLKNFSQYNGGLDVKDDTTGLYSVYREYLGYQIMFHVSTLLPFTSSNRQQLMRKRHIGNDIVTIIFQEPGAHPFTPKSIRSQFQHVFIVVRARNPCTPNTHYTVSVSRSVEVPAFGPSVFGKSYHQKDDNFLAFLLAKIINAENATYRSEKFTTMATRTRNEYLKDLYVNHTHSASSLRNRFSMLNLIKKRPQSLPPSIQQSSVHQNIPGAISWRLQTGVYVAISSVYFAFVKDFVDLVIRVSDLVAYTNGHSAKILLHYLSGETNASHTLELPVTEVSRLGIITKLKMLNKEFLETEKVRISRRSNNLGFHIQNDGLVTDVDRSSPAGLSNLRPYSRVVMLNEIPIENLGNDQMIELLKQAPSVDLVVVPPGIAAPNDNSNIYTKPLNSHEGGGVNYSPAKKSYINETYCGSSSSGYGTGSSSKSYYATPPPPLPRRRTNSISRSHDNIFKQQNRQSSIYYDFSKEEMNQRVAALKSAYLTPTRRVVARQSPQTNNNFERDLLRLIDIDNGETTQDSTNILNNNNSGLATSPTQSLETRVALLEAKLAHEQKTKEELKMTLESLKLENRRLLHDYEVNKQDVQKLKALLRI